MKNRPQLSAHTVLGLIGGTETLGQDVAGTINGESASGVGQILTGDEDNDNTTGIRIQVTLTADDLVSGNEGSITITKGIATLTSELLARTTDVSTGTLTYRANALQKQIEDIGNQIDDVEERLEKRREDLYKQFYELEQALGAFQSQSAFLEN